jgi:ATP-dependent helicase/nuclease subunit B
MKVITGPSNSGKSEHVISRVAQALLERPRRVMLIVPSSSAATVMQERLERSENLRALGRVKQAVTTFPSLYTAILADFGIQPIWLGAVERERLLRQVITELVQERRLDYFNEIAGLPGLISAVAGFIDELWRSATEPAEFRRIAQRRSPKDRDLAQIYESYAAALAASNAVDSESAGARALIALKDSDHSRDSFPTSGKLKNIGSHSLSMVAADGFDFYTPVQVQMLSLLAARGVDVLATLTYEEGRAVHLWQKPTAERLSRAHAVSVQLSREPRGLIEQAAALLMTDGVEERLAVGSGPVQIISAPDRAAEVVAVARELKRLVVEEGFALQTVSILCRSLSRYAHHLERVFRQASIPLSIDCTQALGENSLILSVERLLTLHATFFARRAVIECLRSPYFDFSQLGIDDTTVDLLDRISMAGNVVRGRDQWLGVIEAAGERALSGHREYDDDDADPAVVRAARYTSLAESVRRFFNETTPAYAASRGEYARWVCGLLKKLRVKQRAEKGETSLRDIKALADLEALTAIIGKGVTPRQDKHIFRDRDISWPHFLDELLLAIRAQSFDRQSVTGHAVVAQEAHSLWPSRFRAVFILGLVEGEFPARSTERAPYTLVEREELRKAGVDLTETPADAGADLTQFYKAMSCATERLYLSHPRIDLDGGELLASYLVEEVSSVAETREIRIASRGAQLSTRNVASFEELASLTAQSMRGHFDKEGSSVDALDEELGAANALLDSRLPSWKATKRGARLEHRRMRDRATSSRDGLIREPRLIGILRERFGPKHLWSASQINDYGTCPFRFYAKHVLRLSPSVEPADGFGPNHLGNAYHQILESLHTRLLAMQIQIKAETAHEAAALVEQVTEEVLERMLATGSIRKGPLWEFDKNEIKKQLVMLLHAEAEWNEELPSRPKYFEQRFGDEGEPQLVIECEDGAVKLCGVIDRIDETEEGLVVIDYKAGRTPIRHADALDGRNLQLPIYAMAASRALGASAKVASAFYLHIHSRKKGSELPHKDDERLSIDAMISHAEERIREYVRRARGGAFPVKPNDERCHPYCEFDVMCRIQSLGQAATEEE